MGRPAVSRTVVVLVLSLLLAAAAAGLRPAPAAAASPPLRLAAPLLYPLGLDPFSLSVAETRSGSVYALVGGMDGTHTVADKLYRVPLGREGEDYVRTDSLAIAAQPRGGVLRDMDGDGLLEALVSAAGKVHLYDWEGFKGALQDVWSATGTYDPILPGDFDEDGILDFVGISAFGGTFSVFIGNGDGTFTAGQSNSYAVAYMTAALGDFNGDGHDDIAVVPNDKDLYILRGDGAGQFATPLHVAEAYDLMGVDVADFNEDGRDDIVSTAGTNVAVLLGNGDCTFSGSLLAVTDDVTRVTACDWDGDGDDDAVGFSADDEGWADVVLGLGNGTFSGSRPRHSLGGTWVLSRGVHDVDHDGRQDIVTAGSLNCDLGVLYQGPDGTLGPRVQTFAGDARRVAVADVDRDASPDLVRTHTSADGYSPLLWAGAWQFTLPGGASLPFTPGRCATADFDNDGCQDLLVVSDGALQYALALGDGAGGFASPVLKSSPVNPICGVAAGDLNRDGNMDLVTREGNLLVVRAGDGAGGFSQQMTVNVGSAVISDTDLDVADLDGDGCLDVVLSDWDSVRVFMGDGAWDLTAGDVITQSGVAFRDVALGDVDGDGIDDVVTIDAGLDGYVRWYEGLGDGQFGSWHTMDSAVTGDAVHVADMDLDGVPEIVVLGLSGGRQCVCVYDRSVLNEVTGWTYALDDAANDVAIADFDGDRLPDVVALGGTGVRMLQNITDVPRGLRFGLSQAEAGAAPADVAAGDLDRDGRLELAVANEGGGTVSVFDLSPDGIAPLPTVAELTNPRAIAFVDFDRNGRLDLAVAEPGATRGRLAVYGGAGDGTFAATPMATATLGAAVNELTAADVNGDGCPDLVAAVGTNVRVQRGNGTGGWLSATSYTAGTSAAAVAAGDVDRDGDPDLVVADQGASALVTLWNSAGTFSTSAAIEAGRAPVDVALGDLDEDGILDAVTADRDGGTVGVYQGTGTGFRQVDALDIGGAPSAVALGDLDGDGLLDLTVKDAAGPGILFANAGRLRFEPVDELRFGLGLAALVAGDFDRDGGCDVACASAEEGGLAVLARDVAAPITTDDAPGGWVRDGATVHLVAQDDALGSGVARTYYRIDEGAWTSVSGAAATVSLRTWKRGGGSGIRRLDFYAVDAAGNAEDVQTSWIWLDSRAPVTRDDTDGLPHATDVTVHLTATDAHSGVLATHYSLDGAGFVEGTSVTIVAPFNSGVHWIEYYSEDRAGNVEYHHWCSVTIVPAGRIVARPAPRPARR